MKSKKHLHICFFALSVCCYSAEASPPLADKSWLSEWTETLRSSGLRDDVLMMQFLDSIDYTKFDIREFLSNERKYQSNLFFWLGIENLKISKYKEAEICIKAALESKTVDEPALVNKVLGNVYLGWKKPKLAAEYYSKALEGGRKECLPALGAAYLAYENTEEFKKIIPSLMQIRSCDINAVDVLLGYFVFKNDREMFIETIKGLDLEWLSQRASVLETAMRGYEIFSNGDEKMLEQSRYFRAELEKLKKEAAKTDKREN